VEECTSAVAYQQRRHSSVSKRPMRMQEYRSA
jgi:hypothetical protein